MAVTELDADMRLYGEKTVYKGLGCLYGLREALRRTLNGEPMPPISRFCPQPQKMLEHRQNLLHTMRYIMDRWNIKTMKSTGMSSPTHPAVNGRKIG